MCDDERRVVFGRNVTRPPIRDRETLAERTDNEAESDKSRTIGDMVGDEVKELLD